MFTLNDVITPKVSYTKNLISDQTGAGLLVRLGSASTAFSASLGWGVATSTSTITLVAAGGFADQRMAVTMRYQSPTAQGAEEFGPLLRFQTSEVAANTNYFVAREQAGVARITRVVNNSFTNLASASFALPPNTDVTITFQVVGTSLSASFIASGVTTVNLSATDTVLTGSGLMGFRTTTTAGYCSTFTADQR